MPSMIAILVADLQRHIANEAKFAGLSAPQRTLREQGMRLQADIAEFILSRTTPAETKTIAAYFDVTVECARKHANELSIAGKIFKAAGYPTRWWHKAH